MNWSHQFATRKKSDFFLSNLMQNYFYFLSFYLSSFHLNISIYSSVCQFFLLFIFFFSFSFFSSFLCLSILFSNFFLSRRQKGSEGRKNEKNFGSRKGDRRVSIFFIKNFKEILRGSKYGGAVGVKIFVRIFSSPKKLQTKIICCCIFSQGINK